MLPVDYIRFQVSRARKATVKAARDARLIGEMTAALIEQRRATGSCSEDDLINRYGFTRQEIKRLGSKAVDAATNRFVTRQICDPVAA